MITEPALIPAALFAVVGAVWDVRTRRIPNWLVALLALAAAGATVGMDGWSALGSSAIHAAIALVVGMGLFALRAIGAGDAKFYSAAALAVPLGAALPMMGWVVASGFALLIGMAIWHRGFKVAKAGKKEGWTLPFAVPIACGFLAVSAGLMG